MSKGPAHAGPFRLRSTGAGAIAVDARYTSPVNALPQAGIKDIILAPPL